MTTGGQRREAVIVGAGIGGLAAAIALHRAGWRVRVLERAASPRELGFALLMGAAAFVAVVFYWSSASGGVDDESLVNRLPLHLAPALVFYLLLLVREAAPRPRSAASPL